MSSNLRYNARRDANEPELLRTFTGLGGVWLQYGPLDGWAGIGGRWIPTEIKDPAKEGWADEFTESQRKFIAERERDGLPYQVWRTEDDVLRAVNARFGEP